LVERDLCGIADSWKGQKREYPPHLHREAGGYSKEYTYIEELFQPSTLSSF
jgi:hypothetical protein